MATEQKKILIRRGNKADLVVADLQPGEPVLALDTNEVGVKTSGGTVLWFATSETGTNKAVLASEKGAKGGVPTLDPITGKIIPMPTPADIGAWFIGEVKEIAYGTADAGWLLCQGQAVSRTKYAALFAKIGTKYGVGDGSTTFNLPNRCGRVAVGLDPNDTDFDTLGKRTGEKEVTLTIAQTPPHAHASSDRVIGYAMMGGSDSNRTVLCDTSGTPTDYNITNTVGGGQAHNNMPPNVVMNYEIYTGVVN